MSSANKHNKKAIKKQLHKCGFNRTSNKIPPIIEQTCAYLEQKG